VRMYKLIELQQAVKRKHRDARPAATSNRIGV